jgi:glycolate oxidase iron-sulfur subunit
MDAPSPPRRPIDTCVHCGFCLPACPTYVLEREEMDSPRGRIHLMKSVMEGRASFNPVVVSHFDSCLGCMSCMTACPSGVDYELLLAETRVAITRARTRGVAETWFRRSLLWLFASPRLLGLLRASAALYEGSGLRRLVRGSGLLGLLPKRARVLEELLPENRPAPALAATIPASGEKRHRVGLLLGCVQRAFFPEVNAATARVLAAEGCEVVIPPGQPCCGALFVHSGEETQARELARRTIEVFEAAEVEAVIINAAGCGSNLKLYGSLLREDPLFSERASRFAEMCKDIAEYLASLAPRAERHPLPLRVVYQDACHLQHAQRVRSEPRAVLAAIPGIELRELPESTLCCGSAGIYNILEPDTAAALGERKAALVREAGGEVLVSGNPGCLLQIGAALRRGGSGIPLMHTVQILDASLRGVDPLGRASVVRNPPDQ